MNEVWATVCGTDFTDDMAGIACAAMGASDDCTCGKHISLNQCTSIRPTVLMLYI